MFETYTTVIGTVISNPRLRHTSSGEDVLAFRVACNSRRVDRDSGEWSDGPTLYLTVSCRRRLLDNAVRVVAKGRPVIAHGQIKTNEYVTDRGEQRADLEMAATALGLDLSRCTVGFERLTTRLTDAQPTDERSSNERSSNEQSAVGGHVEACVGRV